MDYSQSLCCGRCVAPYSVVIVPCLGLSDPVLLPGPGGRGEAGSLPKCGLWALPGLRLLCVTRGPGDWDGVGQGGWLAAAAALRLGSPCSALLPTSGVVT